MSSRLDRPPRGRLALALPSFAATATAWAVLPAALAARAAGFAQFTDQAVLELQVAHATRAVHLLGPYSRFHWNHPGPFFFYLMAPLYALSDQASRSIWISVWLLNVACIFAIVFVTGRAAGRFAGYIAFALLTAQTLQLGPANLGDPWGPYVVLLPFELCLFAGAAVASGAARWLTVAVLAGSFVMQTNVSTVPATLAALVASVGCGLVRAGFTRSDATGAAKLRERFGPWVIPSLVAMGVTGLVWAPTVIEQLESYPGNLTKLADFAANASQRHEVGDVWNTVSHHLVAILPVDPEYRTYASSSAVRRPAGLVATSARLLVVLVPLTAWLAWRAKRTFMWAGCLVAAAAALATLRAGTRVEGPLMSYLFMWTTGIGTLVFLLFVAELAARAQDALQARAARSPPTDRSLRIARLGAPLVCAATAVAGFLYGRTLVPETPYFYGKPSAEIVPLAAAIERHLSEGGLKHPVMRPGTHDRWGIMAGVLLRLYKKRVPFAVDRDWRFMFGPQFRDASPPDTFFVFGDERYEAEARDVIGCALIAQTADTYVYASPVAAEGSAEGALNDPCP